MKLSKNYNLCNSIISKHLGVNPIVLCFDVNKKGEQLLTHL